MTDRAPQILRSRDNELLVRLRRLASRPGAYREDAQVWLEGDHLCRAFLEHGGQPMQAVVLESAWETRADIRALAQRAARVALVPENLMRGISSLESPPPLGMLVPWPQSARAGGIRSGVPTVVLDRLQDPGNAGSILRSAAALGVVQVLALTGTVALWSGKVLRSGMGAHFGLHLVEGLSVAALEPLWPQVVVTTSHGARPLHEADLPADSAFVFGHEGGGVDPALLEAAACRVTIPQPGGQESLNVAAAAAVCLYEAARRRWAPPST